MSDNGTPTHWKVVRLADIADVRLGRQRSPKRAVGDHMRPYMRAANVTWKGIDIGDVKEMDFTPKEFQTYELRAGDILLAEASGSSSEVGKPAIWRNEVPGACFQNTLIRVRAPRDLVPFLHLHFFKDAVTGAFARSSRGVGIHHLGAEAMSGWPITLPPPDEQGAIVAAIESHFSRLDAATATLERVQRNLERYRASVLKAAVEGRLVPTEAELAQKEGRSYEPASVLLKRILAERRRRWEEAELAKLKAKGKAPTDDRWNSCYEEPAAPDADGLPELPEGWCWASVSQLISRPLANGRSVPTAADGFPVLRLTAIRSGRVLLSERKVGSWTRDDAEKWLVAEGDFLVVRGNGSRDIVGRGGLVTAPPDPVAFPDTLIRVRIEAAHFEPRLLRLVWDSQVVRDFLQRTAKTTAGIYKINQGDLESLPLPLPPFAEQARLAGETERLDSVATVVAARVEAMRAHISRLRRSILRWAFDGRLVALTPGTLAGTQQSLHAPTRTDFYNADT